MTRRHFIQACLAAIGTTTIAPGAAPAAPMTVRYRAHSNLVTEAELNAAIRDGLAELRMAGHVDHTHIASYPA